MFAAVVDEAARCELLDGVLEPGLLDGLRRGELRDLAAASGGDGPAYRVHADTTPLVRSLRDYEHLLMYTAFLNLLVEDGVEVRGVDRGGDRGGDRGAVHGGHPR